MLGLRCTSFGHRLFVQMVVKRYVTSRSMLIVKHIRARVYRFVFYRQAVFKEKIIEAGEDFIFFINFSRNKPKRMEGDLSVWSCHVLLMPE